MVEDRMLSKITSVQLLSLPFDFVLGVFARAKCEEKKIKEEGLPWWRSG